MGNGGLSRSITFPICYSSLLKLFPVSSMGSWTAVLARKPAPFHGLHFFLGQIHLLSVWLLHRLQRNFFSCAWSTSSTSFSSDHGVCKAFAAGHNYALQLGWLQVAVSCTGQPMASSKRPPLQPCSDTKTWVCKPNTEGKVVFQAQITYESLKLDKEGSNSYPSFFCKIKTMKEFLST